MAEPQAALTRLIQELLDERFGPVPEHERIPAPLSALSSSKRRKENPPVNGTASDRRNR
jgi:hypothetical protein